VREPDQLNCDKDGIMSKTIYLDPLKTAPFEPSEGDERNGFWISPFEVPKAIFLRCETGFTDVRAANFKYSGGETGEEWTALDDRSDPPITVRCGRYSSKILELTFGHPISVDQFRSIGERLKVRAQTFKMIATRFNYQMIAAILQNWQKVVEPIN
jgi:hypothetical protein